MSVTADCWQRNHYGLITASARIFHEEPQTLTRLKAQPDLSASFVEEALRYYSPFSATVRRMTKRAEIAGQTIAAGELVVPLIASANRDERVFENPDTFQIDRNPNQHLGLGFWYSCLFGAHLARFEGKIVVEQMAERYSAVTLTAPKQATIGELGGPKELAVDPDRSVGWFAHFSSRHSLVGCRYDN